MHQMSTMRLGQETIITNVMNHFFLNLLCEWNVKLGQNNED